MWCSQTHRRASRGVSDCNANKCIVRSSQAIDVHDVDDSQNIGQDINWHLSESRAYFRGTGAKLLPDEPGGERIFKAKC